MSGSGADPDPLDSFGTRGTRGIRGGRAAKRKREAFLRYQESQGQSRASIPVIHSGGQAHPLYTPCTWEPETSTDEEPEVVEFVEHLEDHPPPKPKGPVQPDHPPPKPKGPVQPDHPPPKRSLGSAASSSSSITWNNPLLRPKPAAPKPSSAVPSVPPERLAVPKVDSFAVPKTPPNAVASSKGSAPVIDLEAKGSAPAPVVDLEAPSSSSTVSVRSFQPINQERLRGVEAFFIQRQWRSSTAVFEDDWYIGPGRLCDCGGLAPSD